MNTATYTSNDNNNMIPFATQNNNSMDQHTINDVMNALYGLTQLMAPQVAAVNEVRQDMSEVRQDMSSLQNDVSVVQANLGNVETTMKTYEKEVAEIKEHYEDERIRGWQEDDIEEEKKKIYAKTCRDIASAKGWVEELAFTVYYGYVFRCFWREMRKLCNLPKEWKDMSLRQYTQIKGAMNAWVPMGNLNTFIVETDKKIEAKNKAKEMGLI